jgi:eukaryotic-like serine/threonine-protein kinase
MPIQLGQRLGPYEILSAIGAGGMGEVYRARDTRLDRIVAVKIIPDHLSDRAEVRERFEREARTIASLNHPHICTLFDIGHQDGTDYLVMEYLEGETLSERLKKGPLLLEQVLQYAIEIADALDKAHRKGITHRDLKPGNIMLTKSGAKLLDFGLAKLKQEVAQANVQLSQLPTANDPLTAQGTIVGTLQYMAPEQLEGKEADTRTDIFAFGVLVYEMATGKKAFEGKSQASVISAIMASDPPPMSSLQPMTPVALDRAVKRCLAKEPDKRWQTASDLCEELKWIAEGGSQAGTPAPIVIQRKHRERLAWSAAAIAIVIAVLATSISYFRRAPAEVRPVRFTIGPPDKGTFSFAPMFLTVSPDGSKLAFIATGSSGKTQLWIRPVDSEAAQPLPGTENPLQPFWSADSRYLAFYADGKLKKIAASGGPAQTLTEGGAAAGTAGGTWSREGVVLFSSSFEGPIRRVPAVGGKTTQVTALDASRQENGHLWPHFLPDGKHFLYLARSANPENDAIYAGSLDSKERKLLLNAISNVVYVPPGYLLFDREGTLMAQPFDAERLELTGEAVPIAEDVLFNAGQGRAAFAASENGVLAYRTGTITSQLVWFNRSGKRVGVLGELAGYGYGDLEFSPDGKQAALNILEQSGRTRDIWIYDVARGLKTRITFDPADEFTPIWSPDGSRLVFNSRRKGHFDLYQKASNGSGTEDVLLEDDADKYPYSWSSDGRFIAYEEFGPTGADLFVLPLSGDRKPIPFLNTKFNERYGRFSPDGRWLAYVSDESGKNEVYVLPYPGPGGKRQVSTAGGNLPRWRHDGNEIFYLATDGKLMAAAVSGKGTSFEVGAVEPLFEAPRLIGNRYQYDVSADGQRFLVNTGSDQATLASAPITVVVNWTAGLKK